MQKSGQINRKFTAHAYANHRTTDDLAAAVIAGDTAPADFELEV